jgi:ATP-dependent RNA helicase DDX31/DBP7
VRKQGREVRSGGKLGQFGGAGQGKKGGAGGAGGGEFQVMGSGELERMLAGKI